MPMEPATPAAFTPAVVDFRPVADVWRRGADLVFKDGAHLPQRCIHCNQRGVHEVRRKVWVNPSWVRMTILAGPLFYALAMALARRTAVAHVWYCRQHIHKRRNWTLSGVVMLAATAGVVFAPPLFGGHDIYVGLGMFLGALLSGAMVSMEFGADAIQGGFVRVSGVDGAFVDTLPEVPRDIGRLVEPETGPGW
ncbi:MAG: hypothetical protein AB2A00_04525 [Myxococcota bacterium]